MSGFLSNLVARSFTDAPVIQPRSPSVFETAGNEFLVEPQSPTSTIAAPETVAPANGSAPPLVSKPSLIPELVTLKSIPDVSDAPAEESLRKPDPPPHALDARAEESVPQSDAPSAQNAPLIARIPHPSIQAADVRKLEVETKRIGVPVNSFRDGKEDPGEKKRATEAISKSPSIQIRRRKDFSTVEQRTETSAPIIRVTIGRIEVRAIHPPAPAPKPARPGAPKLSLDEYLRGRKR